MPRTKKTEVEESKVEIAVDNIEDVVEDVVEDLAVSEEDEKDEEFFQMSDIGEDEDEVTDEEISEDM